MLLGIILMFLGILGGAMIFAYIIIDEKKRKREIEIRKRRAKLKNQKMQEKKAMEIAKKIDVEDDVKIYMPKRGTRGNMDQLTQAN